MNAPAFDSASTIALHVTMHLTEAEVRALEAIAGYGTDSFLATFYTHLGNHYLKPHEAGARSLFGKVTNELPGHIRRIDAARRAFRGDTP